MFEFLSHIFARAPRAARPVRPAFSPQLEGLEDRCVLSTILGRTSTNNLVRFDSATPGTLTTLGAITGLAAGQNLVGIDFRPRTGELYGLGFGGTTGQLYQINGTTALRLPYTLNLPASKQDLAYACPVVAKAAILSKRQFPNPARDNTVR